LKFPKSGEPESQSKFQPSDPEGYMAMDHELQRNHFESFSLRFEIPEARRAEEPKKFSTIGSSEEDLKRQIIRNE
jgi:hypothetical protein